MVPVDPGFVVALRRKNPCLTLRDIAQQTGVTSARVRQILAREGMPTAAIHISTMRRCGQCKKSIAYHNKSGFCMACLYPTPFADIPCYECGKLVHKAVAAIANNARRGGHGRVFCDRTCFGHFLARTVGFLAHPENRRLGQVRVLEGHLTPNAVAWRLACSYRTLTATCAALGVKRIKYKETWLIPEAAIPAIKTYLARQSSANST